MAEPSRAQPPEWWAGSDEDSALARDEPDSDEPDRPAEPSWATVVATTLRLWLERHGLRRPAGPATGSRPRWRGLGLLGLVLVVFAAGALTVALIRLTAGAGEPLPPLRLAVDWPLVAIALAAFLVAALLPAFALTRARFREAS